MEIFQCQGDVGPLIPFEKDFGNLQTKNDNVLFFILVTVDKWTKQKINQIRMHTRWFTGNGSNAYLVKQIVFCFLVSLPQSFLRRTGGVNGYNAANQQDFDLEIFHSNFLTRKNKELSSREASLLFTMKLYVRKASCLQTPHEWIFKPPFPKGTFKPYYDWTSSATP